MISQLNLEKTKTFKPTPERLHKSYHLENGQVSFINFNDLKEEDALEVLKWRNHPQVRNHMYKKEEILPEDHLRYLSKLPFQNKKFYWVVKERGKAIGVIDIVDFQGSKSEWGFYLNPDFVGTGKSLNLIYHALNFFFKTMKFEGLFGFCHFKNTKALIFHDIFKLKHTGYEKVAIPSGSDWYSRRVIDAADWLSENFTIEDIRVRKNELRVSNQSEIEKIEAAQVFIEKYGESPC